MESLHDKDKSTMKVYETSIKIEATADKVWKILTDGSGYPDWDPNIERVEGEIELNNQIKVFTKLSPGQAFPVKVTEFESGKSMTWLGGMPLGLFKGERTFRLEQIDQSTTQFKMKEVFSGILFPLIGKTIPDLTQAFEDFAHGLKTKAES